MPCFHPLRLYRSKYGPSQKTGKVPMSGKYQGPGSIGQDVPCGQCIGCRLERSRQWAVRCEHERKMHDENCFVTFTYRDDALLYGGAGGATLYPRHLQTFWKRLRKSLNGKPLKYFACGEYGDESGRPHYHAIIFGHDFADKFRHSSSMGNPLYVSPTLDALWGHGHCIIGEATFESSAYVARYIMKKHLGKDSDYYQKQGLEPEFVRMSRRPAIGFTFYDKYNSDIYPSDTVVTRGGILTKPPRAYDKLLEKDNKLLLLQIKMLRIEKSKLKQDDTTSERLAIRKRIKLSQIKSLKRRFSPL